jgi:hypothetical protein
MSSAVEKSRPQPLEGPALAAKVDHFFTAADKRYGTFYADTGIGTLLTTSVFPTLLHQDPRYFQLGSGGIWHRAMYSVSRIFVTRADNGDLQFNSSEIVGNAVAAGLSNTYHSPSQRTLGNTLSVWGTDIMLNAVCNVAKEFWPDLRRKLHKPKNLTKTDHLAEWSDIIQLFLCLLPGRQLTEAAANPKACKLKRQAG